MKEKSINDYIYISLIITCSLLSLIVFIYYQFFSSYSISNCYIFEHFGIYCPGCGCTRAFESFLRFDFLRSVYYNPAVLYGILMVSIYLITQTIQRILKQTNYIMPYSNVYLYIGIFILITNCVIRNILLLIFHIPL